MKKELVEERLLKRAHRKAMRSSRRINHGNMKEKFELPEKWAIKRTMYNSKAVNDWNNNHPLFKEQRRHHATSIVDGGYFYSDTAHWGEPLLAGYTEITFEQFQEYVLNINPVSDKSEDYSYLIPLIKTL